MPEQFEHLTNPEKFGRGENIGYPNMTEKPVAQGRCPYCDALSTFNQAGRGYKSKEEGKMVGAFCTGCQSVLIIAVDGERLYPAPKLEGLDDLPEQIDTYYQEALRCLAADAPNGATTLFRKVINAVCLHYEVTDINENDDIYTMINRLSEEGYIVEMQRQALLATKDVGNAGAHINDNDPDIPQARRTKELVDAVLNATVKVDQNVAKAREDHPNPHQE